MKSKNVMFLSLVLMAALVFAACGERAEEPVIEEPAIEEIEPLAELTGKKVAVLIAEGFHDGETIEPKLFLEERGAEVVVLGPAVGDVQAYNSERVITIEKAVEEAEVADFDALILPGGKGPAVLREHEAAVNFAREFMESGKPVAAICHGPQVLVTAGVLEGRRMTCVSEVAEEVQEAGGEYVDESVVVDGNLITSRVPADLPAFNEAILNALKK
ncbi:MAG: type 1 glutamine amidotransferase domain-containing protein [Candidatus Aminicenantes bacterium]